MGKRIPIEAISRFLPVFSNENEEREVVVKDSIDFTKTKDRTDCFVNEVGNIISSFLSTNFDFQDSVDCVKLTNNMLQMINASPIITKILEGKS